MCEPELNLFEECVHDPTRYSKFKAMATPGQKVPKDYFANIIRSNYFWWIRELTSITLKQRRIHKILKNIFI